MSVPIIEFVNNIKNTKGKNFMNIKNEIKKKNSDGIPKYALNIKDNDSLFIIYHDNSGKKENLSNLEKYTKSCIFDKYTLDLICTQYNKILYNADAINYLKDKLWENVTIEKCYEGTVIVVFYHKKWYVSTRRCLDAYESVWIKDKSYGDMFNESILGKFTLDELDKSLCYHFILVHNKNKNIINYTNIGYPEDYKEVIHTLTVEKSTLKKMDYTIPNVKKTEMVTFNNLESLLKNMNMINAQNMTKKMITFEGYIIKVYDNKEHMGEFTILKLQTKIYQELIKLKPNNSNVNQSYLELYQNDKLSEYLPYFSKYNNDIIKRIHMSMRNIAKEILDLYHGTRQKKNPDIYMNLTDSYKKIIYGLHGLFIDFRRPNKNTDKQPRSITVHDVYHYLKNLTPSQLRQVFSDRAHMIKEKINVNFFNTNCLYTLALYTLMFKTVKK